MILTAFQRQRVRLILLNFRLKHQLTLNAWFLSSWVQLKSERFTHAAMADNNGFCAIGSMQITQFDTEKYHPSQVSKPSDHPRVFTVCKTFTACN